MRSVNAEPPGRQSSALLAPSEVVAPGAPILIHRNNSLLDGLSAEVPDVYDVKKRVIEVATFSRLEAVPFREFVQASKMPDWLQKQAAEVGRCAAYLQFVEYFGEEGARLVSGNFCRHYKLCRFCARRRSWQVMNAYRERVNVILSEVRNVSVYHVTFTLRNGDNLPERLHILRESFRVMVHRANMARNGVTCATSFGNVVGGVSSVEVKRGSRKKLWHPHIHALLLVRGKLDHEAIVREWAQLVRQDFDSTVKAQHAREVSGPVHDWWECPIAVAGFAETFKYAVKFSDMAPADLCDVTRACRGLRMLQPFGWLKGVPVPESFDDEWRLDGCPYAEYLYRWTGAEYVEIPSSSGGTG